MSSSAILAYVGLGVFCAVVFFLVIVYIAIRFNIKD